jgi:folate-binding protein YgfZ
MGALSQEQLHPAEPMHKARLADRALVAVTGPDAEPFLQNILTVDLDALEPGEAKPGALLAPQGKILFDFLISRENGGLLLDCRAETAEDFQRRLMLYRLRARTTISVRDTVQVAICWDGPSVTSNVASASTDGTWLRDRRFADAEVFRNYCEGRAEPEGEDAWTALRIAHGVAESGCDFALGDAFPHDVLLDQLGGIGFTKGCYVGQEVVSRMQHRGTARRRVLVATGAGPMPPTGTEIIAGDRPLGNLGSVSGTSGLAIVRIDRVAEAVENGTEISAAGVALSFSIPPSASFTFPQPTPTGSEA